MYKKVLMKRIAIYFIIHIFREWVALSYVRFLCKPWIISFNQSIMIVSDDVLTDSQFNIKLDHTQVVVKL